MTTRTETITRGFELLRTQCDPRGHDLIDALEDLCLVQNMANGMTQKALETVLDDLRSPEPSNVIPLINAYTVKT